MPLEIIDFDWNGRTDFKGSPLKVTNGDAITNAIQTYLQSRKGDYVNNPNLGGLLDTFNFRRLKGNYVFEQSTISSELSSRFSGLASVRSVTITPNRALRYIEITVNIYIYKTQEERILSLFKKTEFNYVREVNYIEVDYSGENLVDFIQGSLLEQPKSPLYYNSDLDCWVWNSFKLINLTNTSDELQYLIEMVVNYNLN